MTNWLTVNICKNHKFPSFEQTESIFTQILRGSVYVQTDIKNFTDRSLGAVIEAAYTDMIPNCSLMESYVCCSYMLLTNSVICGGVD